MNPMVKSDLLASRGVTIPARFGILTAYNTICPKGVSRRIQVVGSRFIFFLTRNDLDVSFRFPQRKSVWMTRSTDQWDWSTWNHQRFMLRFMRRLSLWNSECESRVVEWGRSSWDAGGPSPSCKRWCESWLLEPIKDYDVIWELTAVHSWIWHSRFLCLFEWIEIKVLKGIRVY